MATIGTIETIMKHGTGEDAVTSIIVCAGYQCAQSSFTMPYRLITRLATDEEFTSNIARTIVNGGMLNLDTLMSADAAINIDTDYLVAREKEYPELVRYDKSGNIRPRTTTPAAFVRRFIVPAIEYALDSCVIEAAGINTDNITPAHLHNIVKSVARTTVSDKVKHTTDTSNADKRAHQSRRARARAHK